MANTLSIVDAWSGSCVILWNAGTSIPDLIIFLLVHGLELNLLVHVCFSAELDHAWLRAKHDENENNTDVHKGLIDSELCAQRISEEWNLWWHDGIIVCSECEYSGDHDVDNALNLSVLVLANAHGWLCLADESPLRAVLNIGGLEPLQDDEHVHPAEQEEEEQEAGHHFREQLKHLSMVQHIRALHDDTEGHVEDTEDDRELHLNGVSECKHIGFGNTPSWVET